jgi:two-component system CheB/CheR fusion protein
MPERDDLARLILDQVDEVAVVFLDRDGTIREWSAGAEKVFGYGSDEVLGVNAQLLFVAEDRQRGTLGHELSVAEAGGNMEDDRWMQRKDGQRVWISGVVKRVCKASGAPIGFAKVMRNRTDLEARTQALEAEAEMLRQKEIERHQLFGTLAHELRNPLAPLFNVAHLLKQVVVGNQQFDSLIGILDRQLEHMRKLIDALLDVTRVAQGKIQLDFSDVDLAQILNEIAEAAHTQLDERQLQFWLLLPQPQIFIRGDALRLRQVFANLLDNAIKYTPPGGRIYLRVMIEDDEAVVAVEDNGQGISPEMLPRIFDLFTQEVDTNQRTSTGLGIGLSLVKELVSLHRGTVQARSDGKGKGSIFYVRLPRIAT